MGEIVGGKITCVFFLCISSPSITFPYTLRHSKRWSCWSIYPMLRISSFTGRPFTITSPEVGSIRPHIMDRSVDLPQPDGPTMDMNCPFLRID